MYIYIYIHTFFYLLLVLIFIVRPFKQVFNPVTRRFTNSSQPHFFFPHQEGTQVTSTQETSTQMTSTQMTSTSVTSHGCMWRLWRSWSGWVDWGSSTALWGRRGGYTRWSWDTSPWPTKWTATWPGSPCNKQSFTTCHHHCNSLTVPAYWPNITQQNGYLSRTGLFCIKARI